MSEVENGHRDVLLETDRLVRRALTVDDLDDLVALDSDPEVMRFLTGGRPTPRRTLADVHLPRFTRRHPGTGLPGFWAAEEESTGGFLGWFELRPSDDDPEVTELGYRLRKEARGMGRRRKAPAPCSRWPSPSWGSAASWRTR
jgi:RimJ/RimL family protein N-acetyltransferase